MPIDAFTGMHHHHLNTQYLVASAHMLLTKKHYSMDRLLHCELRYTWHALDQKNMTGYSMVLHEISLHSVSFGKGRGVLRTRSIVS